MKQTDKKRQLSPEESAECAALKAIYNAKKKELKLTQDELGERLGGIGQSSVSHYLNGVNALNKDVAAGFSRELNVPVEEFSPRLASEIAHLAQAVPGAIAGTGREIAGAVREEATHPELMPISVWDDDTPLEDDEVEVPFLREVELSAGQGRTAIQENNTFKLRFGKRSLRKFGVQFSNAVCVTVKGNSMEPVLRSGATIGVDRGKREIIDGDLYAISHAGQLRVKQVYRLPGGGIRLRSFNRDEHPDEEYSFDAMREQGIEIIGRVFWSAMFH